MMTVRFGNVVNSAGSVVPLFREQIARGGPVTITHPEVTRFFMTIPEASQLVLQSAALGNGGEIFILNMGTPIKIADLARDLIHLSGKEPDSDIEIVYTGLREGEKLYEELITEGEGIVPTSHEKILVLKPKDYWQGNKSQEKCRQWLLGQITELEEIAWKYDGCAIRLKMKEIVPEYDLQDSECIL
jgi:FlaA1/EpsC-like NDP-sugar epimerase